MLIVAFVFLRNVSLRIQVIYCLYFSLIKYQVLLTFLIMLMLLYLQIRLKPYHDPKLNRLETITFLILIFYVYSGLFFFQGNIHFFFHG